MITKSELLEQKQQLVDYIYSKIKANDFHAVQDAASDIREILAKLEMLNEVEAHANAVAAGKAERYLAGMATLTHQHAMLAHQHVYKYDIRDDQFHCTVGDCQDSYPSSEQWNRPVPA